MSCLHLRLQATRLTAWLDYGLNAMQRRNRMGQLRRGNIVRSVFLQICAVLGRNKPPTTMKSYSFISSALWDKSVDRWQPRPICSKANNVCHIKAVRPVRPTSQALKVVRICRPGYLIEQGCGGAQLHPRLSDACFRVDGIRAKRPRS